MDLSYESKYLKYKIKYYKLKQSGGGTRYSWPEGWKDLKGMVDFGEKKYKIKKIQTILPLKELPLEKMLTNKDIIGWTTEITDVTEDKIVMNGLIDKNGIKQLDYVIWFEKQHGSILLESEPFDKSEDGISSQSLSKDLSGVAVLSKSEEVHNFIELKKEIEILQNRLEKIENKFNNHYHDIPTSGIRQFDI